MVHELVDQSVEKRFSGDDLAPHRRQIGDPDHLVIEIVGPILLIGQAPPLLLVGLVLVLDVKPDRGNPEAGAHLVQELLPVSFPRAGPPALDEFLGEFALLGRRPEADPVNPARSLEVGGVPSPAHQRMSIGRWELHYTHPGPRVRTGFLDTLQAGC